jgi:tetratricopeptide (TPR) repeat protein
MQMRKLLALLLISVLSPFIGSATAVPAKVLLINNKWIKTELLSSDEEGNLRVKLDKKELIIRRQDFVRVALATPPELLKAEKLLKKRELQQAFELTDGLTGKYNFPPLGLRIKLLRAQIKNSEENYKEVVSILTPQLSIDSKKTVPEAETALRAESFLLLGNAYAKLSKDDAAVKAYRRAFEQGVPEYSAQANLASGRMLLAKDYYDKALRCFLENIAIFSVKTPGRRESLEETIKIYKKIKDKNYKVFEEMLKKEYPEKLKS